MREVSTLEALNHLFVAARNMDRHDVDVVSRLICFFRETNTCLCCSNIIGVVGMMLLRLGGSIG